MKKVKKKNGLFLLIKKILFIFYPKYEIIGETIPNQSVILVGNHAQIHGPLCCELYFPVSTYAWCAGQMMNWKEVPEYAFQDFWSQKPKWTHLFYRMFSFLIAPLSVLIFNHARTVPVYRDIRSMSTFKKSLALLRERKSLVIFPEHDKKYNHIIYDFNKRFIDIASIYHKKTGKEISFVPFYIAPYLKKIVIGNSIVFSAEKPMEEERERIRKYLMEEITTMAEELPPHTVVPYRNIPKKYYPNNKKRQTYENTSSEL